MLAKWPAAVARAEMEGSRERIEREVGLPVRHLAYPVGDASSAGPREFALARELGFASAVTTRPGMVFAQHKAHLTALPRLSVNGNWQDARYLEALLSGVPFALWNRGRRLNVA
jgi:peptidoglycan/xylan/chitin deacetylase (PgdA/CDA1 family)